MVDQFERTVRLPQYLALALALSLKFTELSRFCSAGSTAQIICGHILGVRPNKCDMGNQGMRASDTW